MYVCTLLPGFQAIITHLESKTKTEKCEKEYHYCHLMFGGECWITKIVTVLTDCEVKVETCCEGWLKDENDETKKGLNCIRKSGCGGKSILREQNGVVQSLNYPQKYNSRNVLKSVLNYE